jgi:hypothetical protein
MPASRFNKTVQDFLEVTKMNEAGNLSNFVKVGPFHRSDFIASLPATEDTRSYLNRKNPLAMKIHDIVYDEILQMVIFASGFDRKTIIGTSKTRGTIQIYKIEALRPSMAVRKPNVYTSHHEYNVWFDLIATQPFTESVTNVTWDRKRRCLLAGLINGIIMYYHLAPNGELTYVGELDYHQDRFYELAMEPQWNYYVAASARGRLTLYDCNEGTMLCQLERLHAHKITCFTFNFIDRVAFYGTGKGSILVYDATRNPPTLLTSFAIAHNGDKKKENLGDIHCLKFAHERKVLVGNHWNRIFIYEVNTENKAMYTLRNTFTLVEKCFMTMMDSFQNDSYISGITNTGNFVCYRFQVLQGKAIDVTSNDSAKSANALVNKAQTVATNASATAVFTGSYSDKVAANDSVEKSRQEAEAANKIVNWEEVIYRDTGSIREWLREREVDIHTAHTRFDVVKSLVNFVAKADPAVTLSTVVTRLRYKELFKLPVFSYPLEPIWTKQKSLFGIHNVPFRRSVIMEEEQLILLGGSDGYLYIFSLHDMFPSFLGSDEQYVLHQRTLPNFASGSMNQIKANQKTSRGKRLQKAL